MFDEEFVDIAVNLVGDAPNSVSRHFALGNSSTRRMLR